MRGTGGFPTLRASTYIFKFHGSQVVRSVKSRNSGIRALTEKPPRTRKTLFSFMPCLACVAMRAVVASLFNPHNYYNHATSAIASMPR